MTNQRIDSAGFMAEPLRVLHNCLTVVLDGNQRIKAIQGIEALQRRLVVMAPRALLVGVPDIQDGLFAHWLAEQLQTNRQFG